ncbi:YciI family protein [Streptomyces macrosporus]|uniref:YciI family protein n=1 Tax=Streptomyces macrosporus TaxID=44032 RepID=A0ABN3KHQ7_9ACTN
MKHYLLSVYQPDGGTPPPEILEPVMRDVDALNREMTEAGVWVFGGGLDAPETATVLRPEGDDVLAVDGPYVEGEEHLGGFTVITVPDRDTALAWGRRLARATTLPIEVRPFDAVAEG